MNRTTSIVARSLVIAMAALPIGPARTLAQQASSLMREGTSSISGHVIAGDTGKPIADAVVEITIYNNISARFRQATSDAAGRFEFTKLPAGTYQIAASATRYLRMQYGQQEPGPVGMLNPARTIELKDGDAFSTADFRLAGFRAIEGVLTDEFGDPVPNVMVAVSQAQFAGGRRRLMPANPSTSAGPVQPTDDRGHFRIGGLAPGDYYVQALSGAFADPSATGGFAVTFYPGTTKAGTAQPVRVTATRDVVNANIQLQPAAMSQVSGTLVDGNGAPIGGGALTLMPSEQAGTALFAMARATSEANGHYTFRNVPPGLYTIQAYGRSLTSAGNAGAAPFGYVTFTASGTDLTALTVTVPAPRTLRGHIIFETGPADQMPKTTDAFIRTMPANFESAPIGGGPSPTKINPDWTFEVSAMSGLRMVSAGARPNWVTKSVTANGKDVTDTPLDLRQQDVNDVEIVLTTRTTTLSGTALAADRTPIKDYNIIIFADDDTKWGLWSRYVTFTRSNAQGAFTVTGLPPATYVAVAIETMTNGEWQNPEFLQKQRQSGDATRFSIIDGESKSVQLVVKRQ